MRLMLTAKFFPISADLNCFVIIDFLLVNEARYGSNALVLNEIRRWKVGTILLALQVRWIQYETNTRKWSRLTPMSGQLPLCDGYQNESWH